MLLFCSSEPQVGFSLGSQAKHEVLDRLSSSLETLGKNQLQDSFRLSVKSSPGGRTEVPVSVGCG